MLESVPKGVLEKPLPSLPEADDVAKIVKSTRRQFRYAVTDDDLLIVLQGIDDLFGKIESGEDEIRVRSFHLPHDQSIVAHYSEYRKAVGRIPELADLGDDLTIIKRKNSKRSSIVRISSTLTDLRPHLQNLVAHLILEQELVDSQMKRFKMSHYQLDAMA